MADTDEALRILNDLGLPTAQQRGIARYTLLALAGLRPADDWGKATNHCIRIHDIIQHVFKEYNKKYEENTREDFRKGVIHQFEQARIVDKNPDKPDRPTNSPNTCYAFTPEALSTIQTFGTPEWGTRCDDFKAKHGTLSKKYQVTKLKTSVTATLPNGLTIIFSPGSHSMLQAAVIEEFHPQYIPKAELLYVGDTSNKMLYVAENQLISLGVPISKHEKLPDVIFFWPSSEGDTIVLVEAVTSHGPVSPKRFIEIEETLQNCKIERIYVTAFQDLDEFKKHLDSIAWGTEVWIREITNHLIHYNGPTLRGPTK